MEMTAHRGFTLERTRASDDQTIEASLSSEQPVDQVYGEQILRHTPDAIDLSRAPFPLIVAHDKNQIPVGIVEQVRLVNTKLRGILRFSTSTRGRELWEDVKAGILRSLSIAYNILDGRQEGNTFVVTRWMPLEVSLLAVPADVTVGIGRGLAAKGNLHMETEELQNQESANIKPRDAKREERHRVNEILAMGEIHEIKDLAIEHVQKGTPLEQFRKLVLDTRYRDKIEPIPLGGVPLGMSSREAGQYSLARAIQALHFQDLSKCGFESECSNELAKQRGKPSGGLLVPIEALTVHGYHSRAIAKSGTGGNLIETSHRPDLFIDVLQARLLIMQLGATHLPGLQGDVSIPRKTAGNNWTWVAEEGAGIESTATFGPVSLSPKSVTSWTTFTRKMLLQGSPGIEQLTRADLVRVLATAVDAAAINGSGTNNEPTGILNTTGVGVVVAGDPDGAAPTWQDICDLEAQVGAASADFGQLAYLTNSAIRKKLKVTEKSANTGQFIWSDSPLKDGMGTLNGYPAGVSENVPSTLTKGAGSNLSALIFGNFADLLVGNWGNAIEIIVDPYTQSTQGNVRVTAFYDVDLAVRHAASFAVLTDAVTT